MINTFGRRRSSCGAPGRCFPARAPEVPSTLDGRAASSSSSSRLSLPPPPLPHSERLTSGSGYVYELQHSTVISEVLQRQAPIAVGQSRLVARRYGGRSLRWLRSRTLSPSRHAVSHVAHGWSQEPIRTRPWNSIWVLVFQGPHCFPRLHRPRTAHHRFCAGGKPTITPSAATQPASLHSRHRTEQHATGCSPRPWPVRIARETAASRPALSWRLAAR